MSDTVLVTGASGFVGSAVARKLAARGYDVRVLMRSTSPRTNLAGLDAEPVEGDMRDGPSMRRAMQGARYLFHVAADYRLWARDREEIVRNNREGTKTVMEAALAEGVEKIVYTSSVATLKPIAGQSVDETSRHTEKSAIGAYKRSKVVAEQVVEHLIATEKLPATIVSPSTPIGPRDVKPTPTGASSWKPRPDACPPMSIPGSTSSMSTMWRRAICSRSTKGQIGERYILGGQDATLAEMLGVIAALSNRKPPRINLPRGPLYPLAYAAEAFASLTGKEPFVTVDALQDERASHVLLLGEGGTRARLYRATLSRGARRCARVV